jgi:hypothetical protein
VSDDDEVIKAIEATVGRVTEGPRKVLREIRERASSSPTGWRKGLRQLYEAQIHATHPRCMACARYERDLFGEILGPVVDVEQVVGVTHVSAAAAHALAHGLRHGWLLGARAGWGTKAEPAAELLEAVTRGTVNQHNAKQPAARIVAMVELVIRAGGFVVGDHPGFADIDAALHKRKRDVDVTGVTEEYKGSYRWRTGPHRRGAVKAETLRQYVLRALEPKNVHPL